MKLRSRKLGLLLAAAVVATMPMVGSAGAQVSVACGQTITIDTTLTGNVGPCPNNGLIIGANRITLDLGGFRIFGTPSSGDGAGVLLQGRQSVTIRNGTVTDFDGGVVILGGGRNTVRAIAARNNIGAAFGTTGPAALYGDGILIQGSTSNTILDNVAENNGPFSGIGVIRGDGDHPAAPPADAPFNVIQNNNVLNNIACRRGNPPQGFCDNDGIRIEPNVTDTQIIGNNVVGNGLDGIALFGGVTRSFVSNNSVIANGFRGAVRGDGIRVFGFGNTVELNTAYRNNAAGVSVARRPPTAGSFPAANPNGRGNTLRRNIAQGNGVFDLWDSNRNPDCDQNVWTGNQGNLVAPPCTLNP